ncbi:hypothetical protein F0L17_26560 [Streptomyces sp. TRM43335]|uniref:SCP domain-containing protein n=1 Tax=Streptomyces taklimakanensis TaxID=2569853 RepID=A0A6G2BKK4_9ACTN|nr:CAP domain-containing protein [Streptomyces taklimakanensis]MTE22593.1 hypothetical protein [Streptomyces taklimakanensis]
MRRERSKKPSECGLAVLLGRSLARGAAAAVVVAASAVSADADTGEHRIVSAGSEASRVQLVSRGHVAVSAVPAVTGVRGEVVRLVNDLRTEAGCRPLASHRVLDEAAQDHSEFMEKNNALSHHGPGRASLRERLMEAGYAWRQAGETLAHGHPDASSVVDAWMDSTPHRRIILDCGYRDVGVGLAHGRGETWWTQIVGTPR